MALMDFFAVWSVLMHFFTPSPKLFSLVIPE
jgi:hypothetical protein